MATAMVLGSNLGTTVTSNIAATQEALVASLPYSVAVLHTVFNVITTLILVWFIPQLVKMVTFMVPDKGEGEEKYRLKYIGIGNIATGDLALNSAKLEVVEYGRLCRKDLGHIRAAVNASTQAEFEEADKKLIHYEEINDYRDRLRNEHLSNIEKSSYPYETGSFYMDLVNCLEKMGDFIINISQSVYGAKTV